MSNHYNVVSNPPPVSAAAAAAAPSQPSSLPTRSDAFNDSFPPPPIRRKQSVMKSLGTKLKTWSSTGDPLDALPYVIPSWPSDYDFAAMSYISKEEAAAIDAELMGEYKYTLDQLMELAGLACAVAIAKTYPRESLAKDRGTILIICGPGNNGGDGMVCARHLKQFGYRPSILFPKQSKMELFERLKVQCTENEIPFVPYLPTDIKPIRDAYNLAIDAVFGFSFEPPTREPYIEILSKLRRADIPIISLDVPSGWDVNEGPLEENCIQPEMLISLTAPKLCARYFNGKYHYLGGRFIPQSLAAKYQLNLPPFPGTEPCVRLKLIPPVENNSH